MNATAALVLVSVVAAIGAALIVTGWREPRPSLHVAMRAIRRTPETPAPTTHSGVRPPFVDRLGKYGSDVGIVGHRLTTPTTLRLAGRSANTHAGSLMVAFVLGLFAPSMTVALLITTGLVSLGAAVPLGLSLLCAVVAPALVHTEMQNRADLVRADLRHQLSAYLDMVTMLLAGNTGHETALQQAAGAGDGLLFRELRRRMREVSTTGESLVAALTLVADDFDLVELEQVASATALSAAEGAPVARTLAAKCSTLRSTLAADQEAKARVRNDKVTPPLVGMALLFMALIIYPALNIG